jgi:hypothetical protein
MNTQYDYSVINPVVDKSKLRELAYMIKGQVAPTTTIHKPTLYLRKINTNNNANIQNVYGNNVAAWRTQGASSFQRPSPGEIAVRRRHERETKTALRELGRMVRGY